MGKKTMVVLLMGLGVGRSWPILTGERGHYELAAQRDPMPFIKAIEGFANAGGMITEQLWDAPDLPDGRLKRGEPTGAAMPLCWSHAEYIGLVRSRHDGVCFNRVDSAFQRYVLNRVQNPTRFGASAISSATCVVEKHCGLSLPQRQRLFGPEITGQPATSLTQ